MLGQYQVAVADDFEYADPVDGSVSKAQVRALLSPVLRAEACVVC